jgi:hypothetical protein
MTYKFGHRSTSRLNTTNVKLQNICNVAIKIYDFSVVEGYRSNKRQDKLFKEGRSQLKGGQSKHNRFPSDAIDIAPYPIDWNDRERFYYLAGIMKAIAHQQGVKIRWGGDWDSDNDFNDNNFDDLPHFELAD